MLIRNEGLIQQLFQLWKFSGQPLAPLRSRISHFSETPAREEKRKLIADPPPLTYVFLVQLIDPVLG
jgi:hypothetical protein